MFLFRLMATICNGYHRLNEKKEEETVFNVKPKTEQGQHEFNFNYEEDLNFNFIRGDPIDCTVVKLTPFFI